MFDNFDLYETCEEYFEEEYEWENWDENDYWEPEPDDGDLEMGFDPYAGCYSYDC